MYTITQLNLIKIRQIMNDLRSAIPVVVDFNGESYLMITLESISAEEYLALKSTSVNSSILISKDRAKYTGLETIDHIAINTSNLSYEQIIDIAGISYKSQINLLEYNPKVIHNFEQYFNLTIYAELIPAMLIFKPIDSRIIYSFNHVDKTLLDNLQRDLLEELRLVSSAELHIKITDKKVLLNCYRSIFDNREHYAILLGEIGDSPLVRLHSSCYTGDLLTSLSCDCHDQFHLALKKMADYPDGGIMIYLIQEGRGIGLANKLRAYNLQQMGIDTLDANLAIGFPDDARIMTPAAKILKLLNVNKMYLLSNNPKKSKIFSDNGINVLDLVEHITELNPHNEHYVQSKFDKMGHKLKQL